MNSCYNSGGQGSANIKVFTDAGFRLSIESAKVKGDVGGTLAVTMRTVRAQWVFDYVMTNDALQAEFYTAVDNRVDEGGKSYPSDHLPIFAEISATGL